MPTAAWVILGLIAVAIWLGYGLRGFGMSYAYIQRCYPDKQVQELWRDFFELLPSVLWGPIIVRQLENFLKEREAWNEEYDCPTFGYKFLPRHEYRYQ